MRMTSCRWWPNGPAFPSSAWSRLALLHALEGNAGPFGHHLQDVILIHFHALFFPRRLPAAQKGLQFFLGLFLFFAHPNRAFNVVPCNVASLARSQRSDFISARF